MSARTSPRGRIWPWRVARPRTLAALGLFALVLTTGSALASTTRQAASPRPTITVAGFGNSLTWYVPLTYAQHYGYFRRAGIDVKFLPASSNAESLAAIISGRVQVALFSTDQIVVLRNQGVKVKGLVATTQGPLNSIIVRNDVTAQEGSISGLRGLTIGVPGIGGSGDLNLRTWLIAGGLDPNKDVRIVGIGGGGPGLIAALQAKRVDAVLGFAPFDRQIVNQLKIGRYVISPVKRQGSGLFWPGSLPWNIFLGREDYFSSHPTEAVAFVKGITAAIRGMRTRPGLLDFARKLYPLYDPDTVLAPALDDLRKVLGAPIPKKRMKNITTWLRIVKTLGPEQSPPPYEDLVFSNLAPYWTVAPPAKR